MKNTQKPSKNHTTNIGREMLIKSTKEKKIMMTITLCLSIAFLIMSILLASVYIQFRQTYEIDYEGSSYVQDGDGVNVMGNDNGVTYGAEADNQESDN